MVRYSTCTVVAEKAVSPESVVVPPEAAAAGYCGNADGRRLSAAAVGAEWMPTAEEELSSSSRAGRRGSPRRSCRTDLNVWECGTSRCYLQVQVPESVVAESRDRWRRRPAARPRRPSSTCAGGAPQNNKRDPDAKLERSHARVSCAPRDSPVTAGPAARSIAPVTIPNVHIFREYDIRGVADRSAIQSATEPRWCTRHRPRSASARR